MPMQPNSRISIGAPVRRRKPSLTPMIDVVFLLLVFFMLTARFGLDNVIPLKSATGGGGGYSGAPRLVSVGPDQLLINGIAVSAVDFPGEVRALMPNNDALVIVRPIGGANLQDIVEVFDTLSAAGINRIVLAE